MWNLFSEKQALLNAFRSDIEIKDLRGNVPTRIDKLRQGNYDAIVLANAGVSRLKIDISDFQVEILKPQEFVPAPAQGVLGLQIDLTMMRQENMFLQMNNAQVKSIINIEKRY